MAGYFEDIGVISEKSNLADGKKLVRSPIISCSRRTDVPAFLMDWVIENINQGYVKVVNPFNRNIVSSVSLHPDDVKCWVWWSKDFGPWIEKFRQYKDLFKRYSVHFFNFTINSPSELESGLRTELDERIDQLKWLTRTFGPDHVQYRFDPIVFYYKLPKTRNSRLLDNLDRFEYIMSKVADAGINEMIFSFATIYKKVARRMKKRGKLLIDPDPEHKMRVLDYMLQICRGYNIQIKACCQPDLVGYRGIKQSHCIPGKKIQSALSEKIEIRSDKGQRENCGCAKSRDIGGYHGKFKCPHNCDYCYANPRRI